MKPFSKFEALSGKPVVTRSGLKVLYITEIPLDVLYPVVAFIEGHNSADGFTSDGAFLQGPSTREHPLDLFMASENKEGWIAFGTDHRTYAPSAILLGFAWPTEEKAKESYRSVNDGREPASTVKDSWED